MPLPSLISLTFFLFLFHEAWIHRVPKMHRSVSLHRYVYLQNYRPEALAGSRQNRPGPVNEAGGWGGSPEQGTGNRGWQKCLRRINTLPVPRQLQACLWTPWEDLHSPTPSLCWQQTPPKTEITVIQEPASSRWLSGTTTSEQGKRHSSCLQPHLRHCVQVWVLYFTSGKLRTELPRPCKMYKPCHVRHKWRPKSFS